MNPTALALFSVSQRPTDHDGDAVRIWQRDLHAAIGLSAGPARAFYAEVRSIAGEHPEIVATDPGYIGPNLSVYLTKDADVWAAALGVTVDDLYEAADDAGLDTVRPLGKIARTLPERMVAA